MVNPDANPNAGDNNQEVEAREPDGTDLVGSMQSRVGLRCQKYSIGSKIELTRFTQPESMDRPR
ncbi:hypothetical protein COLO4_21274 [Corchorus olitorius]|uniref:Uncharacterized protein n=1 Tax=Corchorus olitorius TaxID=93759 RepID=A0A1R3IUD1_9ROSI|nr:hypothetical protein COLO4_21274 [Corchorus olitorius]